MADILGYAALADQLRLDVVRPEITAKLLAAKEALSLDRVFAQVDWGALPSGMVADSIGRYATEITPELR
jgi:hypothetical protein